MWPYNIRIIKKLQSLDAKKFNEGVDIYEKFTNTYPTYGMYL